jgi:hypothetical protein
MKILHPANAEELGNIAQETGADVIRGALRYPSESGGWQVDTVDLNEHLAQYRDHNVVVIIAAMGEAEPDKFICGICGFAMDELAECPRCKLINQMNAWRIYASAEERKEMFEEVKRILHSEDD